MIGDILWEPPADLRQRMQIGRFMEFAEPRCERRFDGYDALWRWSVEDLEGFWGSIWDFFEIRAHAPYETVLASREMPGAVWFPGARINYAEHLLGREEDTDTVAVIAHSQTRPEFEVTFGELREQVARARAGLRRLGRRPRRPRRRLPARTSPRRSWPSSPRRRWGPSGPPARRSSGRAASSTASPRSSPRCCWPSVATASATAT